MLRITIDLVPFGEEAYARKIAEAVIYNDATGNHEKGNYVAGFCEHGWINSTTVTGFDRRRSVWALLRLALKGLPR